MIILSAVHVRFLFNLAQESNDNLNYDFQVYTCGSRSGDVHERSQE